MTPRATNGECEACGQTKKLWSEGPDAIDGSAQDWRRLELEQHHALLASKEREVEELKADLKDLSTFALNVNSSIIGLPHSRDIPYFLEKSKELLARPNVRASAPGGEGKGG